MADFDEKLNSLLSNPEAMAQIMQMAQNLMGGQSSPASSAPEPPPAQPPVPPPPSPEAPRRENGPDLSLLSSLGSMDPAFIAKLLPLIQELGGSQDSNARRLLFALRPYLKPERQEKVERALQLARLFHLGRRFLSQ